MGTTHSKPQLEHDHVISSDPKSHQTHTPSRSTKYAIVLDSNTNIDQLTTSIANPLAKTDLPTTQPRPQDSAKRTANNSLPVELWMHIFDHLRNTVDYARPPVVAIYKSALAVYDDTTLAAHTLPAFEKRSWKQSRPFYHIDRTSRAAALRMKLCLRLLQTCKAPSLATRSFAKAARLLRNGRRPVAAPEYWAVKVSEEADVLAGYREAGRVLESLAGASDDVVFHSLGLGSARRIVLLERCNWNTVSMLARAREIEVAIYEFWRRKGIRAGVVEIV